MTWSLWEIAIYIGKVEQLYLQFNVVYPINRYMLKSKVGFCNENEKLLVAMTTKILKLRYQNGRRTYLGVLILVPPGATCCVVSLLPGAAVLYAHHPYSISKYD